MKSFTSLFVTTAITLVLSSPGRAQQDTSSTLTLQQAVMIALQRNQDLTAARLEIDRAEAQVLEAWGYAMPALDFQGRYTRALKKPVFFLPSEFTGGKAGDPPRAVRVGSDHSLDLSLTGRQTLFNASVITGVGASRIYARAAREGYHAKRLEVVTNVRKAYYRVLLAAEAKRLMQANLANAEENLGNVQLLSKQGVVSEYDELRATVGVENLRPAVIQAENNEQLALDGLRVAMGADQGFAFRVADTLRYEPVDEGILADAPLRAVEQNLGLRALRLQIDIGEAFVDVERSSYLPSLSAFGNYQYQLAKNNLRFSPGDLISSSQVGLVVSLSVFQGLQTSARVQQAKVNVRKIEEQVASVETNLRTAANSAVLRLREAGQRIKAQEKTVEQAERGYRIATTRFLNGSGTQLEVNDAQLALSQARVNRIQAVYDYVVASADLDVTIGRVPDYVVALPEED
jgi:outer membrane protein TolC